MASEKQTTVNLTEKAQAVKEDLAPVFGLKNILSAGLILLDKLSAQQQKSTIAEANDEKTKQADKKTLKEVIAAIKEMVEVERQQPGTVFRVLSYDEEKIIDEFRQLAEPEKKGKTKKLKTKGA